MRNPIQLLMLPLVILASHTAVLGAQLQTTHADPRAETVRQSAFAGIDSCQNSRTNPLLEGEKSERQP